MMNLILFSLSLTLLFHSHFSTTQALSPAKSPAASPPAPPLAPVPAPTATPTEAPTASTPSADITKILGKSGRFTLFLRLLKNTNVGETINSQLSNSNSGLTVFAPTDSAFSTLGLGTLNSLPDKQQIQLVQFHILPNFFSITQLQTVSNPLRTQAGENGPGEFPLNVTTVGSQEKLSTGLMNTTITDTLYTDNKLVVYQVDSVLLPSKIFGSLDKKATPVAAANSPTSSSDSDDDAKPVASGAVSLTMHGMVVNIGVAVVASFLL
ncbi:fasciclin-like arabinogalactan protein 11 [Cornus florida]|uniref:fasciclin-like arabinogalactan protein 11 n=1 Tax=Cornus florida TaxID=4283 RepID=UPI002899EA11|nr:fasciclin-like arabinogalactan protein 11 [Cornus florida]